MPQRKKKNPAKDEKGESLYESALSAVRARTLEETARATGLPFQWLRKFRSGTIKNPGVQRIETILTTFGLL